MIVLKQVQDFMRSWTAVIDVSENMQLVDGESLDDVCDGNDKGISPSRVDDRINDDVDVCGLVRILRAFMEQFLNDIREVFGTATRWWIVI